MQWSCLVAACMVGTIVCVNVFNKSNPDDSSQLMSKMNTADVTYDETYQEDALNYAMVDYNDVYNHLSGSGY